MVNLLDVKFAQLFQSKFHSQNKPVRRFPQQIEASPKFCVFYNDMNYHFCHLHRNIITSSNNSPSLTNITFLCY